MRKKAYIKPQVIIVGAYTEGLMIGIGDGSAQEVLSDESFFDFEDDDPDDSDNLTVSGEGYGSNLW